jgi:hypothetical protein
VYKGKPGLNTIQTLLLSATQLVSLPRTTNSATSSGPERQREQRETCGHLAHSQQLDKLLEFKVMIKGYLNTLIHVLI